jgi:hypothetical protein
MGKFTKQLVSTVVTLSTVLSSVGLGAFAVPSMASAATLMNGDLIKASGPAVYYYSNGRRFVFPNEATYRSWFADFSGVRTITDSELAAIMIGGNVTMRPGTSLVKITTDPRVYAVTRGGVLHWVESEQIAIALFGSNWARRVVDVPDQLFVNYSIGSSVSTAVHPDGSLVSYSGSSDRYVVMNGMRRRVTDAGFSANMFQATHVIPTTINYSNGADVVAREAELADAVVTSGSPTTPVSGSLTVSLASDTTPSMVLPKNAQNVMFTKVNLMAGSSGATVSSMRFRRVGVGSTSDFSNVYLYKADGTRLTSGRTISSTDNSVTFSGLNLTLGAGATQAVYISADLGVTGSTGGQHLFELADMGSVMLSGTGSVAGNFPIRGNAMTVGTASVATVTVTDGSEPANPRTGASDAELANFRLALSGTNADVEVRRITLYQTGTISNSDLGNLRLFQGTDQVASASSIGSDGKIVLNFTTPFVIPNGQTRTFNLRGSVSGRSDRTIRIYTEYTSDVYAVDRTYNVGASVDIDGEGLTTTNRYDGTGTDEAGASFSTVEGGQFTITYNGPATANVAKGQNDVVFYKFAITSGSNDVEIRKFNFAVTSTGVGLNSEDNGSGTEYLRDIKIKDADTGETVVSPVSCTSGCENGYKAFNSGSISVLVRAGQTRNFVITADTSSSISTSPTYVFSLGGASDNRIFGSTDLRVVDSGEFLAVTVPAPNTTVTGNTMTVQPASFNVTLAGTPSSAVAVKNQADIRSVAFTLSAGSQNAIRVTSLKVNGEANISDVASWNEDNLLSVVNSCGLFDGETQVGSRQSPGATTGEMTFSGLNLQVARGSSKTLEVRCTADSTIARTAGDQFFLGIASTSDVSAQDEEGNSVTPTSVPANSSTGIVQTVRAGGTLTIAANNQRSSTILVADNETWQTLARYRADAQYEDVTIDYLGVTSTGPSANFRDVAVVQSADANCSSYTVRGTKSLNSGVSQVEEVDLSSNPIVVAKGSTSYICLMARLASTTPSSTNADVNAAPRSGNVVALGIPTGALTVGGSASTIFTSALYAGNLAVRATGSASGERVYQAAGADIEGNSFIVRRAKPVVTQTQGLSTALSAGQKTLYSAQIGAEGGSVAIKQLTFQITAATTSNMTLSNFRISKGGADMNLSDVTIIAANNTDLETDTVNIHESTATSTFLAIVRFTNEEVISGSGTTYALRATVGGLSSTTGDSITTSLAQKTFSGSVEDNAVTGYLALNGSQLTIGSEDAGLLGLDTNSAFPTTSVDHAGAMLWSDMSEVPHSSSESTSQSRDWTYEYLVDTISGSQVLNK